MRTKKQVTNPITKHFTDLPLADYDFQSYRCRGRYGYIMIGAKTDKDAFYQAQLSGEVHKEDLEKWNGSSYEKVYK